MSQIKRQEMSQAATERPDCSDIRYANAAHLERYASLTYARLATT